MDKLFLYGSAVWFLKRAFWGIFLIFAMLTTVSSSALAIQVIGGDEQVQISWIAPTNNADGSPLTDLEGYNVYRGVSREEQTEKANKDLISGTAFVDTGLKNGQTYYYVVTAQDYSGNESAPSELVFATPTILPPAGFTAIGDDGKVKLFWEESRNPSIRGYLLYKTLRPGQNYQKITDVPIECTYFEDLSVENGLNYYYLITSVNEDGLESPYSEEKGATPVALIPVEPSSLKATYEMGVVRLEWSASSDRQVAGYHVYRRDSIEKKRFQKLTGQLVTGTSYLDDSIEESKQYLYSVVGVDGRGKESQFPLEVACYTQSLYIASLTEDTEGKAKKADDKITIIMRGEPGCRASFTIEGLIEDQPMQETGPGVYYQEFIIPERMDLAGAELTGHLVDPWGNKSMKKAPGKILIKNDPPPPVLAVSGKIDSYGWPEINWTPPDAKSFSFVEICRSSPATDPDFSKAPVTIVRKGISTYTDGKADAGAIYYYALRTVDEAGNRSKISEAVRIDLGQNNLSPAIFSITDDTLGIPVKTGRLIQVTLEGDRGCEASFSITGIVEKCLLKELRPGLYRGEYLVKSSDKTAGTELIAKLTDQGNSVKFAKGKNLLRINVQTDDQEPPNIKLVEHNGDRTSGISGKLVAGDSLGVHLLGDPGGIAFFSLGREGKKIPMEEARFVSGEYHGIYTIRPGDDGEQIDIYGYLSDQSGNVASKISEGPLSIDTHPIITVTPQKQELPANNEARTEVVIEVEDINGQPLSDHHIALTLTTTDEYTDVIGGGNFGQEIDGKLDIDFEAITDTFGEVKATYKAGFAAKTAMIIAKDLDTGYAGVGYVTTFIESGLDILLLPRQRNKNLMAGAGDAVYMILEADPQKITADGRSWTRITVRLLDEHSRPVVKPYRVTFAPSSQEGSLSPQTITTNNGIGHSRYVAGKSIGTVVITAVASREGAPPLSGCVSIILMSDAPAKILMAAEPDHLVADSGQSSRLSFAVTDINDNPSPEDTVVQLRIKDTNGNSTRNGSLSASTLHTDRNGETDCTYMAGNEPGTVRIVAKVSSRIPNAKEVLRARGTLFIPLWEEEERDNFDTRWTENVKDIEGTIQEWFRSEGDEVRKGEPLARVEIERHGTTVVVRSPYNGKLLDIRLLRGEDVLLGQTIGFMEIEEE